MFDGFEEDSKGEATRSVLARLTVFFAVVLVVSFGLCGFTALSVNWLGNASVAIGFVELAGMIVGAAGLLVVGLVAVLSAMFNAWTR